MCVSQVILSMQWCSGGGDVVGESGGDNDSDDVVDVDRLLLVTGCLRW